jgi:hypothetical protein
VRLDIDSIAEFNSHFGRELSCQIGSRHLAGNGMWFDPTWEGMGAWVVVSGSEDCSYCGGDYKPEEFCPVSFYESEHDAWVRAVVFALGQAGWVGDVGDGVLVVRNALADGRTNAFELL